LDWNNFTEIAGEEKIRRVSSTKLGTWNVRTLNTTGKEELLERECKKFNMNFVGLTETKRKGPGGHYYTHEGSLVMHSKAENRERRVGTIVDKWTAKKVIGYEGISDRIMIVRLAASPHNITICIVYAPTSAHSDVEVEIFYEQMTEAVNKYRRDICFLIGDFNAKVGKTAVSEANGCFGLGERNERRERLVQFCREQRCDHQYHV